MVATYRARLGRRQSEAVLERELLLAREAIAMVASGASPRVVLAGIRFGDTILAPARRIALESGVVNTIQRAADSGTDLVVEQILP
ncbi:MAG TPA: hypothetical protein VMZ66_07155 [Aeromicrobium sp.]|nr:hypothetical protein [Aeromicrobium sp.]